MSLFYLDKGGLTAFWGKVKGLFSKTKPVFINFHSTGNHFWDDDYNFMDGDEWWVFDSITSVDGEVLTNAQFYSTYSNGAPVYLVMNSVVSGTNYYITIPLFSQVDSVSDLPSNVLMFRPQWYSSPGVTRNDTTIIIRIDDSVDPYVEYIYPTTNESDKTIYDNTLSGLTATNVQDAIDEVKADIPTDLVDLVGSASKGDVLVYDGASIVAKHGWYTTDATWIGYDNYASGLSADYVGDAIDELASGKNPLIANYTSTSQSSISLSSGTTSSAFTDVTHVKLTPGIWLLFGTLNFATNASGTRAGLISTDDNATGANYWGTVLVGAANGMNTRIQVISIVAPNSNTTYYLEAKQTSGSTLTTTGQINYLKLR